jgi:hypothetical protein
MIVRCPDGFFAELTDRYVPLKRTIPRNRRLACRAVSDLDHVGRHHDFVCRRIKGPARVVDKPPQGVLSF